MYRWAYSVHCHSHGASWTDHHHEPPIPVVIGYVGQVAANSQGVEDPTGQALFAQELASSNGVFKLNTLGVLAAAWHMRPQTWTDLLPSLQGKKDFDPVETLCEWIRGRLLEAATGCDRHEPEVPPSWSPDMQAWCDKTTDIPQSLVLGYVLHAACHYGKVADVSNGAGAMHCRGNGWLFSVHDGRSFDLPDAADAQKIDWDTWFRSL